MKAVSSSGAVGVSAAAVVGWEEPVPACIGGSCALRGCLSMAR